MESPVSIGHASNYDGEISDEDILHDLDDTPSPSWATLLPAQYSMGRPEQDIVASNCHELWDPSSVYGKTPVLNNTIGSAEGPRMRLLRIHPDVSYRRIRADLVTKPVFDTPRYTALSYSWSSAGNIMNVFVGKAAVPFPVSWSLWCALRRIRDSREFVYVWVDAVCINQQNMLDKSAQVHIMAQIYGEAQEVRIWLGEDILPQYQRDDQNLFLSLCHQDRPWWKRTWILQECAYAQRCPVVVMAEFSTTLDDFVRRWVSVVGLATIPSDKRFLLRENLEYLRVPHDAWLEQVERNNLRLPLLQRLNETIGRQCSDPRDRVYALLSLIPESEARQIPPNYEIGYRTLRKKVEAILRRSDDWDEEQDEMIMRLALPAALDESARGVAPEEGRRVQDRSLAEAAVRDSIVQALHAAVVEGSLNGVLMLLHVGADLNAEMRDERGNPSNVLNIASGRGHRDVTELLLSVEADVRARWSLQDGALQVASAGGHRDVVEPLLNAGASIDACRNGLGTALQAASERGHEEVVSQLLERGAEIIGSEIWTAAEGGHREVVRLLLDAGAEIDSNTLRMASDNGHQDVVDLLVNSEAWVNRDTFRRQLGIGP